MRCDQCRHWEPEPDGTYRAVRALGQCRKAVELWDATEWENTDDDSDDAYQARVIKPEHSGQMSFVQDGSDYSASLWTKPDFFCAHFEAKP